MSDSSSPATQRLADSPMQASSHASALVRHRWPLFMVMMLLTAIAGSGVLHTSFDTSLAALLTRSDPYLDEFEHFNEQFPQALSVNAVFVPLQNTSAMAPDVLSAVANLQSRFLHLPGAERMSSLLNYFSPQRQERLFQRAYDTYSETELAALLDHALGDQLLRNSLLSESGDLTFATIVVDGELNSDERLQLATEIIQLRDSLRAEHPSVAIHFSSDVLLEQSSQQAMVNDLTNLLPIVILICVLVICYCFRSVLLGIGILTHALLSVVLTVGTLGYLGFAFNSISIIAPLIVVIIAVANSVHIISIYTQTRAAGEDSLSAMVKSLDYNLRPISLAVLTTAIGFSSLNLCSSPAIQDFGRIVAIGIGYAYLLTLCALPAILLVLSKSGTAQTQENFLQQKLNVLVNIAERYDARLFAGCTALAVATFMLLPLNKTDFNRTDFISSDDDIRGYYDVVSSRINRGPQLSYAVDAKRVDGAIEPEFLRNLEGFVDWLDDQQEVESAASLVDLVKTVNRVQHQDNPDFFVIPADIDTVAAHLNGYETVQSEDFPLSAFINRDFSMVTLIINAIPMSNQELIDLDVKLSTAFNDFFDTAELVHGSGLLLFSRMDELVTVELLQGYSLSLLLITLCLVIGLRSVYFGILSVIPNLIPATIVFGLWALLVGQLDPFVMMLFSISIGLVVDDTVHILSHYLSGRKNGLDQPAAIRQSITVAGPALTITTLVLALGTTILIMANTLYFQQSAKLLVPIVVLALVLDLFYLPTILKRFDRGRFAAYQQ